MMDNKIKSLKDLEALKRKARGEVNLRSDEEGKKVTVHLGTCGIAAGARDVLACLMDELTKTPQTKVVLRQTGCAGLCDQEPMLTYCDESGKQFVYGKLDKNKVKRIIQEHVLGGKPAAEYLVTT